MSKYYMAKSYSGLSPIKSEDLLTAVKISMNHEADLYEDGKLICSWLGLPMEDNIEKLHGLGISTYEINGQYRFKWLDESKKQSKVYVQIIPYTWEGEPRLQVNVHDYCSGDYEKEFPSMREMCFHIQKNHSDIPEDSITILVFGDEHSRYSFEELIESF